MKKCLYLFVICLLTTVYGYAEDQAAPAPAAADTQTTAKAVADTNTVVAPETPAAPVPQAVAAPAPEAPAPAAVPAVAPAETQAPAAPASENLEFVSGEISSLDEAASTLTIKLYGETENKTSDKILTVKVDTATDITDGEQDRALKSLTAGTEVDVEYDPATNKATYIFVY